MAYDDLAVVFDLGNVLIRWDPHPAVAAGVGAEEAGPVPGRRGLRLPGLEPPPGRRGAAGPTPPRRCRQPPALVRARRGLRRPLRA